MENDWNFEDNIIWRDKYPLCNTTSLEQSPINIDSTNVSECNLLCKLEFNSKPSNCLVKYSNNTVKLNYDRGSYIKFNNTDYMLQSDFTVDRPAISIHIPSLHTIDNERFDMEIVMTYSSDSEGNQKSLDNGVIISRFANMKGGDFGNVQDFLNQFINKIPYNTTDYYMDVPVSKDWGIKMLEPKKKSFFTYKGSLPYPPCRENYTWILFTEVENIGETNYKILKDNIGTNIRPLQRLNNRKISFNVGALIDIEENLKNQIESTNKFLRCEKKQISTPNKQQTEVILEDNSGLNESTIRNIKNIFLFIVTVILFVLAMYMVKYMYKQFYVQIFFRKVAGSVAISDDWYKEWVKLHRSIK